jgi:osmotically inducible protein OsmC
MKRSASAQWSGDLKGGGGTMSTASKVLSNAAFSFGTRFEEAQGTNPEELVAAAHAGCFSMAFSHQLSQAGFVPESVQTTCTVTFEKVGDGFEVTESHLTMRCKAPGTPKEEFDKAADAAKGGCPISKLLKAKIFLEATLET